MSESKEVRLKIFANLLKMLRYLSKILLGLFLILLVLVISVVKLVDRSPYKEQAFYQEMDQRLDLKYKMWRMGENAEKYNQR